MRVWYLVCYNLVDTLVFRLEATNNEPIHMVAIRKGKLLAVSKFLEKFNSSTYLDCPLVP